MLPTRCPFCANRNPQGARFCNECGSPLHLAPCANCEAVNDVEARACHRCGVALDRERDAELVGAGGVERAEGVDVLAAASRANVPTALSSWLDEVGAPRRTPSRPPPVAPAAPEPPSFGDEPSFSIDSDVDAQDSPRALARPRNHRIVAALALVLVIAGAGAGYLALRQAGYLAGTPLDFRGTPDAPPPALPSDASAPGAAPATQPETTPAARDAPASTNELPESAAAPIPDPSTAATAAPPTDAPAATDSAAGARPPPVTAEEPRGDPAAADPAMRRPALPRVDPSAAATDEVIARELRNITPRVPGAPSARDQARP